MARKIIDPDGLSYLWKKIRSIIPTKTSEIENDSGFITSASVPTVPTKISELTNDSGYITSYTDTDTTYKLSKSGSTITLTGSDGSTTSVADSDTTYSNASSSAAGLMSSTDKSKLDGIATGANAYTHPSYTAHSSGFYKVTVDSTGHVSGVTAVTKADLTGLGIPASDTNTTYSISKSGSMITLTGSDGSTTSVADSDTAYSNATTSASGLMSADDKAKLDGMKVTLVVDESTGDLLAVYDE